VLGAGLTLWRKDERGQAAGQSLTAPRRVHGQDLEQVPELLADGLIAGQRGLLALLTSSGEVGSRGPRHPLVDVGPRAGGETLLVPICRGAVA
jgi:hypothetical protein